MKYIGRIIAILLVLALSLSHIWAFDVAASSATQQELREIQGELSELEDQIEEESELLQNLRQELQELRDEMFRLDTQIAGVLGSIEETEDAIDALSISIAHVLVERAGAVIALDEARASRAAGEEILAARVRAMHESGQINILDVLFNAESITDFLVRLEDLRTVIRFNRELIERLEDYEKEYSRSNEELFLLEGRLQDLQRSYESQQEELEWHLSDLYRQREEKNNFMAELETNEEKFELLLELLEKEYYALQERLGTVQARFNREVEAAILRSQLQHTWTQPRAAPPAQVMPGLPVLPAVVSPSPMPPSSVGTGMIGNRTLAEHEFLIARTLANRQRVNQLDGAFLWPVPGVPYVSQGFTPNPTSELVHFGVDVHADPGHRIVAMADGIVVLSGWTALLGNTVIIDHENGYRTVYGHNLRNHVREGQRITRGQHIADIGSTGPTLSDHLHFEVFFDGSRVDPMRYFGW